MASKLLGCVSDFFTYETTKSVVVKSWSVGIINRIVQLLIIAYFVGWVFIHEKAYQMTDTGIESSVMTKVKGFGYHNNRVMDVADYVSPSQILSLFISFYLFISLFFSVPLPTPGRITGVCLKASNESQGSCEIEGWCPAENDSVQNKPMLDVQNFTIFIKNSIRFPLFNVTRGNFPSNLTAKDIKKCIYHPVKTPYCPIFRVGDVLKYIGHDVEALADKGGEIGINIEWKCNLDLNIKLCEPRYSFTRLDAPFMKNAVSKGYNFRFAKYFKTENGTEFRTLHKAYAIRFDIMVTGIAGKFNTIPTLINLVAAFTSVGLGTVLCDIILLNFLQGAEQYKAKKFEEVSGAQIEASLSQSQCSQLSIKPDMKSSYDSGAVSLTDQAF
uniref:P2X purinoceptor n=1 Tax=Myripristis murdjan TaxID=586833 RepID=A0A667YAG1_9TELE